MSPCATTPEVDDRLALHLLVTGALIIDSGSCSTRPLLQQQHEHDFFLLVHPSANSDGINLFNAHTILAFWFTLWLSTLAYLNIATKYSATAATAAESADSAAASDVCDRCRLSDAAPEFMSPTTELLEHARASNNAMALVSLVSLSCFMRGLKLSYEQSVPIGIILLACVIISWCVQPEDTPLDEQPIAMWIHLAWVILALCVDIAMVRANEKVRRRLFHLQRVMETSNLIIYERNNLNSSGKPLGDGSEEFLDLESPVQKVLNLLRQMQLDTTLIEWQAAIETAIHKLSRAKLHDLFLPSAVVLASAKLAAGGRKALSEVALARRRWSSRSCTRRHIITIMRRGPRPRRVCRRGISSMMEFWWRSGGRPR